MFGGERIGVLDNFRGLELVSSGKTKKQKAFNIRKGFAEEAAAFLEGCKTGRAPIPLDTLLDTTLVTLLAAEDLRNPNDAA